MPPDTHRMTIILQIKLININDPIFFEPYFAIPYLYQQHKIPKDSLLKLLSEANYTKLTQD